MGSSLTRKTGNSEIHVRSMILNGADTGTPHVVDVYNGYGSLLFTAIIISFSEPIAAPQTEDKNAFTVTGDVIFEPTVFDVSSVILLTANKIMLMVESFINADADLRVVYNNTVGTLKGLNELKVDSFSRSFTPATGQPKILIRQPFIKPSVNRIVTVKPFYSSAAVSRQTPISGAITQVFNKTWVDIVPIGLRSLSEDITVNVV